MKLVELKCPNCGSNLKVEENTKLVLCQFCGTQFKIDDEVQHIQYDNAAQTGYEFEVGRMRAKQDMENQQRAYEYQRTMAAKQTYKKSKNEYAVNNAILFTAIGSGILILITIICIILGGNSIPFGFLIASPFAGISLFNAIKVYMNKDFESPKKKTVGICGIVDIVIIVVLIIFFMVNDGNIMS